MSNIEELELAIFIGTADLEQVEQEITKLDKDEMLCPPTNPLFGQGFECRTGHTVISNTPQTWEFSWDVETANWIPNIWESSFEFVIVPRESKRVTHLVVIDGKITAKYDAEAPQNCDDSVLGHGSTPSKAWEDAAMKIASGGRA